MTNRNPSGLTRTLVLAGAALALLFTAFSLARGTGIGFLRGVWLGAALWTFLAALAHVLWRGFRHRDWSAFNRHELPEEDGERFDWRRRPVATPGSATWRTRSFTVTTRVPPFRRRPPSRRTQTCKQPPCRLPRRALRPKEVELGREGGGGRASGRMSASFKHPPGRDDMMQTPRREAHTFLTHLFGRGLEDERYAVERFRSMDDGDIRPLPAGGSVSCPADTSPRRAARRSGTGAREPGSARVLSSSG